MTNDPFNAKWSLGVGPCQDDGSVSRGGALFVADGCQAGVQMMFHSVSDVFGHFFVSNGLDRTGTIETLEIRGGLGL